MVSNEREVQEAWDKLSAVWEVLYESPDPMNIMYEDVDDALFSLQRVLGLEVQ